MKKELKDYLHLYLGCEVMCFWQSTNPAIKPEQKKLIAQKSETPFEISLPTALSVNVKPILRTLSDMREEEAVECWELTDTDRDKEIEGWQVVDYFRREENFYEPKTFLYLLSKHFDLFGLIKSGLAIDKNTLKDKL